MQCDLHLFLCLYKLIFKNNPQNELFYILSLAASLPGPPDSPPVLSYQSFKVSQSAWCRNNNLQSGVNQPQLI